MHEDKVKHATTQVPEENLSDLPVADEQAQGTSGGAFSRNPFDDNGHGTYVSGTIGAIGN